MDLHRHEITLEHQFLPSIHQAQRGRYPLCSAPGDSRHPGSTQATDRAPGHKSDQCIGQNCTTTAAELKRRQELFKDKEVLHH